MDHSGHPSLAAAVSRCQILAGRVAEMALSDLIPEMRALVFRLPAGETLPEQLAIRMLVGQALSRIAFAGHLDTDPAVALAFVGLAAAPPIHGAWCARLVRIVECLVVAISAGRAKALPSRRLNRHVDEIIDLIAVRSRDASLTLHAVAKDVNLSSCCVARILKDHTGMGFVAHARRSRVTAAQRLLSRTTFSVKEISAAVGYRSSRQLDRDFKRLCGVTPTLFRESASAKSGSVDRCA
jgi:AraC-like DNA-binding protein